MTSTEDLLRDGLARLAPRAPADQSAYAGLGRALTRRRRRRAAARAAAVTAVGLMSLGVTGLVTRSTDEPGYSTDVTTTTAPDAAERPRTTFGPASFVLPDGWSVVSEDEDSMCVGPEGTADLPVDCAGVALSLPPLVGYESGPYVDHGPWGWHTSTDPMACPFGSQTAGEPFDSVTPGEAGTGPIHQDDDVALDGRPAAYDEWEAECSLSGFEFTSRAWHVADPEILVMDLLARPETEALLASLEFDEDTPG